MELQLDYRQLQILERMLQYAAAQAAAQVQHEQGYTDPEVVEQARLFHEVCEALCEAIAVDKQALENSHG